MIKQFKARCSISFTWVILLLLVFGHFYVLNEIFFFIACFRVKLSVLVGPSNVPLEGYHCPRVVLVQKATVLIRQSAPVSPNLVPVPQTALDFHLQLRTLSYQSHPIRMANPPLVFKPIGGWNRPVGFEEFGIFDTAIVRMACRNIAFVIQY